MRCVTFPEFGAVPWTSLNITWIHSFCITGRTFVDGLWGTRGCYIVSLPVQLWSQWVRIVLNHFLFLPVCGYKDAKSCGHVVVLFWITCSLSKFLHFWHMATQKKATFFLFWEKIYKVQSLKWFKDLITQNSSTVVVIFSKLIVTVSDSSLL